MLNKRTMIRYISRLQPKASRHAAERPPLAPHIIFMMYPIQRRNYLSKEGNSEVLAEKSFSRSHHINNFLVRLRKALVCIGKALKVTNIHAITSTTGDSRIHYKR